MTRLLYLGIPLLLLAGPAWCQTAATAKSKNNWPFCPAQFPIPARPIVTDKLGPNDIEAEADKGDMVKNGMSHFEGNVELTHGNQQATADSVDYSEPDDTAVLTGNVNYWDESIYLHGETAHLNFKNNTGRLNNAHYKLIGKRGRGKAKKLYMHPGHISQGTDIDFTTCDPSMPGRFLSTGVWKLSASRLTLNYDKERAYAHNVVLWVKKIPVFYTPYLTWPLTKERKSGFLIPSMGYTNTRGFELLTPLYWNIAPNMDATFTPRVMSSRGVMAMAQYRYLFSNSRGDVNLQYLPSDSMRNNDYRGRITVEDTTNFSNGLHTRMLLDRVSDREYFQDFGNQLSQTSTVFLQSYGLATYRGASWSLVGRLRDIQIANPSIRDIRQPYAVLPQINLSLWPFQGENQINFSMNTQVVNFVRLHNTAQFGLANVNGVRFDIYPTVSYPYRSASWYVEPKLGVRFTQYNLQDPGPFPRDPNRLLPVFSIDSGLEFDRTLHLGERSFIQTLEPRLFYLYVPHVNQTDLPLFDTSVFEPSYSSLFLEDRFTSADRVGDANRVTLAVQSRLFDAESGSELGYIRLAQPVLFAHQDVLLDTLNPDGSIVPYGQPYTNTLGLFVAEAGATLFHNWHLRGDLEWDPNNHVMQKASVFTQYEGRGGRVVNLGYRVQLGPIENQILNSINVEQTDFSFQWPLTPRLSVVGRWSYAIPERKTLELFGGVEYQSCCWAVRLVGRRYLSGLRGTYSNGFFLQLELKGLAGIGESTESFLKQRIPGYEGLF